MYINKQIMVMIPAAFTVCRMLDMDFAPFVVFTALGGNIGGLYLVIGDPKNLIVANNVSSIAFADFPRYILPGKRRMREQRDLCIFLFVYQVLLKSSIHLQCTCSFLSYFFLFSFFLFFLYFFI
jgi:Na+/H+ antiporter NhaD/arsenite permease-like protein